MTLPTLPASVTLTDITLRDGLQSLPDIYPIQAKVEMFSAIADAGFKSVEVTSFMRPDRVPQLADADLLLEQVDRVPGLELRALVANRRGIERAVRAKIDVCSVLVTLSNEYCRRNQGTDVKGNLALAQEVVAMARDVGMRTDVSFSMPIFCPYEGPIPQERFQQATEALVSAGVDGFTICTSTGLENPAEVVARIDLLRSITALPLGLHLHDTNGMAMAIALAGLIAGVDRFETALGGVGGGIALPTGMPSHGNLPTEDLLHMVDELGIASGLNLDSVIGLALHVGKILERTPTSRATAGATKRATMAMSGVQ